MLEIERLRITVAKHPTSSGGTESLDYDVLVDAIAKGVARHMVQHEEITASSPSTEESDNEQSL